MKINHISCLYFLCIHQVYIRCNTVDFCIQIVYKSLPYIFHTGDPISGIKKKVLSTPKLKIKVCSGFIKMGDISWHLNIQQQQQQHFIVPEARINVMKIAWHSSIHKNHEFCVYKYDFFFVTVTTSLCRVCSFHGNPFFYASSWYICNKIYMHEPQFFVWRRTKLLFGEVTKTNIFKKKVKQSFQNPHGTVDCECFEMFATSS